MKVASLTFSILASVTSIATIVSSSPAEAKFWTQVKVYEMSQQ